MIMILQKSCNSSLVACNIYITAAATASSTLPSLLARAQDHCRQLRLQNCTTQQQHEEEEQIDSSSNNNKRSVAAAIVHAYADIPYDRSSFHLAGQSDCVAEVAIGLIQNALNEIEFPSNHLSSNKNGADANDATNLTTGDKSKESRHPYVGLVDHVSVMPIACKEEDSTTTNSNAAMNAANAARKIGNAISDKNSINMHYYGLTCPNHTSLATVRRRKTSFFNSGGALDSSDCNEVDSNNNNKDMSKQHSQQLHYEKGDCTIGAPPQFVENYNIRLTRNVDFNTAKTLTQALRGRNISTKGIGVPGVEALTLPYHRDASLGGDVFEVACNLTDPKDGSVEKIEEQLEKWIVEQQQQQLLSNLGGANGMRHRDYFIEKAYRVGTTEEQCINAVSYDEGTDNDEEDDRWIKHDIQVLTRFKEYLMA
jgi:glutamate formiminotransferase